MKDTLKEGSRGMTTRELQTALNALGADLLVDGIFGDKTRQAVCDFQEAWRLATDGVVGTKTWTALNQALARLKHTLTNPLPVVPPPARKTDEDLRLAGEKAVERALAMWKLDIYDPKMEDDTLEAVRSKQYITDMIHSGLGWTWEPPYEGDGDFEWCLAFVSVCWIDLKPGIRKLCTASTYRLDRYAGYRTIFGEKPDTRPADGARMREVVDGRVDLKERVSPRAGDILLVGKKGYGTHGCLVESYDAATGLFRTIEGNAYGAGPNGERQQGVIRRTRALSEVRRIIRPGVDDLA